jgi:antitoxin component YwqK of YwqJK toxin-antitoxin module
MYYSSQEVQQQDASGKVKEKVMYRQVTTVINKLPGIGMRTKRCKGDILDGKQQLWYPNGKRSKCSL